MRDLDPSLAEWADKNRLLSKVNIVALTVGTLVLLGMLIFLVVKGILA